MPMSAMPVALEDTFMWQDPRGHFHALFHSFVLGAEGGHGFSRDGVSWTFGSKANGFLQDGAYSLNVTLRNQTVVTLVSNSTTIVGCLIFLWPAVISIPNL